MLRYDNTQTPKVFAAGLWGSAEDAENLVVNGPCHVLDVPFSAATCTPSGTLGPPWGALGLRLV